MSALLALPPQPAVAGDARSQAAWACLQQIPDPEVPVISLVDLGIVRAVGPADPARPEAPLPVVLTPTYSGCPATEAIATSVRVALFAAGVGPVDLQMTRSPAWSSDWISEDGRRRLREYGIAPPTRVVGESGGAAGSTVSVPLDRLGGRKAVAQRATVGWRAQAAAERSGQPAVACPRCDSGDTELLSPFGATACKALYRCRACREPFEHFKPI